METLWEEAKAAIKKRVPDHIYSMWIEPMELDRYHADNIVLACPNFFSKKRVQERYGALIESEIASAWGSACKVSIEVSQKKCAPSKQKTEKTSFTGQQLSLPNLNKRPETGRFLRSGFTFDNFVVGNNNDYAYSAALSLASQNTKVQRSLFLISKTGMGKSHLSQAIGHYILSQYPSERVFYITAEDFTNDMIHAFQNNSFSKFKNKFRNHCDALVIEDIHFLSGKERSQVELASALDYLVELEKKIIFTSCYAPADIPKMSDTLKSRLSFGLISNIEAPDFNTRIRILKKKSKENGYNIPVEVTNYLAGELYDNVRQLESGLIGVAGKSSLLGMPIDLSLAESIVKTIKTKCKMITIDSIKKLVCKYFDISIKDIVSLSRKQRIVRPRQIAMYLSRKYTDQPLQTIGKSFNRYHATAIHAIATIERELKEKNMVYKQVDYLCQKLKNGKL